MRLPRYRALLLAGGALSLATASDAFIFLTLHDTVDLGNSLFPLLFVGSASTYMLLAVPKFGRVKAARMLNQCRISQSKTVGGLSDRQRQELIALFNR